MIDFPANPTTGQQFTTGGVTWTFDGVKWTMGGTSPVNFGDTPPLNPTPGTLWWNTTVGQLYIWYVDPNTSQWVIAVNSGVAGPQGIKGDTGLQGPKGDTGATGPIGPPSGSGVYVPLAGGAMTGNLSAPSISAPQAIGDNLIINGDMRIDQRGVASGAGLTTGGYCVDRWQYQCNPVTKGTVARLAAPPGLAALGFTNYLSFTSNSAYPTLAATDYFTFVQYIEADMLADLAWGSSGAQPVTLSFAAYSSIAGTFSGSFRSPTPYRSYPFTFSIPTANVWTPVSVTIPGDTAAGTWVTGNVLGLAVFICFGVGTTYGGPAGAWASVNYVGAAGTVNVPGVNGAVFGLTGVKLEVGTVATPYNRDSLAKVLADCQRYYQVLNSPIICAYNGAGGASYGTLIYPTTMRAVPTLAFGAIGYGNASGLVTNNIFADNVTLRILITAAGSGYAQAAVFLAAEL
jgi:hypothetical protein